MIRDIPAFYITQLTHPKALATLNAQPNALCFYALVNEIFLTSSGSPGLGCYRVTDGVHLKSPYILYPLSLHSCGQANQ